MVDGQLASPVTVRVTCYTITNNYMEKKSLTCIAMGKTHFTDGLNCYTITNNYMEKKWLTRKFFTPWQNGLRVSHVTDGLNCYTITNNYMEKKWLTRKPWEKPILQTD